MVTAKSKKTSRTTKTSNKTKVAKSSQVKSTRGDSAKKRSIKRKNKLTGDALKRSLFRQRMFFFAIVLVLVILTGILIWPFMPSLLLALAMVVILHPLYRKILKWPLVGGNEQIASGSTIAIFALIVAAPLILATLSALGQAVELVNRVLESSDPTAPNSIFSVINDLWINGTDEEKRQVADAITSAISTGVSWFASVVSSMGSSLMQFFTNAMILIIVMFVLFPIYRRPGQQEITDLIPLPPSITSLYLDKTNDMIMAMFKGIFIVAIVQGLIMGLVLWIAGVQYWLFLGLISMVLAIIPLVGVALVAWPVGIVLILSGQIWQGIFVIAMFLLIVTNVDTILRPKLVPKGIKINPALVVLSVFGGLQLMGIVGALYGPVIMILLVTSIEVYTKYILRSDLEVLLANNRDVDLKELGLEFDRSTSGGGGGPIKFIGNLVGQLRKN